MSSRVRILRFSYLDVPSARRASGGAAVAAAVEAAGAHLEGN